MRTDIDYNQLVYSKQDLVNTEHTLVFAASDVDYKVYVNFNYAIHLYVSMNFLLTISHFFGDILVMMMKLHFFHYRSSSLPRPSSNTNIS